jgi:hypothetical protein
MVDSPRQRPLLWFLQWISPRICPPDGAFPGIMERAARRGKRPRPDGARHAHESICTILFNLNSSFQIYFLK